MLAFLRATLRNQVLSQHPTSPSATKGQASFGDLVSAGLTAKVAHSQEWSLCSPVRYLPGTPWFRLLGIPGPLGAEAPFPFQDGLHHSHRQQWGGCHAEVTLVWGQGQPGLAFPPWAGRLFLEQCQALLPVPEKSFNQTLTLTSPIPPQPSGTPGSPRQTPQRTAPVCPSYLLSPVEGQSLGPSGDGESSGMSEMMGPLAL